MTLNFDLYVYMHIPVWTPELPSRTSSLLFAVSGCKRLSCSDWAGSMPQRAGCGPSPPALSISSAAGLKQGWEKGTDCIRAGTKKSRRAICLSVCLWRFTALWPLHEKQHLLWSQWKWEARGGKTCGSGWGMLMHVVLGWLGRDCHLFINVSLLCAAPLLPLAGQGRAFSSQESRAWHLKQRRAGCMELGYSKRGKAVSQRGLSSWVPNWHLEYESSGM